jgi:hypothetical protein
VAISAILLSLSLASSLSVSVKASESLGVDLDEVMTISIAGEELRLRGQTAKNNSRQAIYVGGLYLNHDNLDVEQILQSESAKRFVLYCQDTTVKPDALLRAFNLGINANHSEQEMSKLEPMISQFNQFWSSQVKQGDKIWVDYLPNKGTVISVNGIEKDIIPGKDFYDAFLKIWIGDKPLSQQMKKQLLGEI